MPTPYSSGPVSSVSPIGYLQIDALLAGSKWGGPGTSAATVTYSFAGAGSVWDSWYAGYEPDAAGYRALTASEKTAFRNALQVFSNVANITFQEVSETSTNVGDIRVAFSGLVGDDGSAAWAYYPSPYPEAGDIWIDPYYAPNRQLQPGQWGFSTMIHEIGHALGLQHPFDDGEGEPVLTGNKETQLYTVMGYERSPYSTIEAYELMLYDIQAIQFLYGANMSYNATDTKYTFSTSKEELRTIWDGGGIDTFDASNQQVNVTIDLREGKFSSIGIKKNGTAAEYNVAIAFNAIIENAIGGKGHDSITGNGVANRLEGGAGNDKLYGMGDDDKLYGNDGNDRLEGGAGADELIGGKGDDEYYIEFGETITELANQGTDTVVFDGIFTLTDHFENLRAATQSSSNNFTGNGVANKLTAYNGSDILDGKGGDDTMDGGAGDDIYYVDSTGDKVIEGSSAGLDTVKSSVTLSLASWINVENLTLLGTGHLDGTGNALANTLTGTAGNNKLSGEGGDDLLDGGEGNNKLYGGAGNDSLIGGDGDDLYDGGTGADAMGSTGNAGNDTYIVDNVGDKVYEFGGDGFGEDLIVSSVTWDLSKQTFLGGTGYDSYVENLTLSGSGQTNATGNKLHNHLIGNTGGNILDGGDGNDILEGGGGNDRMIGGAGIDEMSGGIGNDVYEIDEEDIVHEVAGQGYDRVQMTATKAGLTFDLTTTYAEIERFTLLGAHAGDIKGNDYDNLLTGNAAANKLSGDKGNDTLEGGAGDDELTGGAGKDILKGGKDDDTYWINLALVSGLVALEDTVTELLNEGTDTLILEGLAALSAKATTWTLWDHVEDVDSSQTGATKIYLTGNGANNKLIGNDAGTIMSGGAGDDTLDGGAGNDRLIGGLGADDLTGGTGNDVYELDEFDTVHEVAGEGYDRAEMTATQAGLTFDLVTDYAEIERFTLMGALAGNITGNDYDNLLTGNTAANEIAGGKGKDTLEGGGGDDELNGEDGNDTLNGGDGSDKLNGGAGDDTLNGGADADTLKGGDGDDTYIVDLITVAGAVTIEDIVEEADNEGNDSIKLVSASLSGAATTWTVGAFIENVDSSQTGSTKIYLTGNDENNILIGNAAGNILSGGLGDDTLEGGVGNDRMIGGAGTDEMIGGVGNDVYEIDEDDIVHEVAGQGYDRAEMTAGKAGLTFDLTTTYAEIERFTLLGVHAGDVNGNDYDNLLTGNAAANKLSGGKGNDTLEGGAGDDELIGGAGKDILKGGKDDDTYRVNLALVSGLVALEDTVTELAGEGDDTLILEGLAALSAKATTLILADHIEHADSSQTGATKVYLTGNNANNKLIGNDAGNILDGGAGDDMLEGGVGNDRMIGRAGIDEMTGGVGNDVYELDEFDIVHEVAGEGYDRAEMTSTQAGLTFDLTKEYAELERFTLMGTLAGNIIGNDYDNLLTGNAAANTLDGGKGKDTLEGGAGNDILIGGDAVDTLKGGKNDDTYHVNLALAGGFAVLEDVVTELAGEGTDTLVLEGNAALGAAATTLTLADQIEHLDASQTGATKLSLTGNAANNNLTGNDADNTLNGGNGNDTLEGGAGDDILIGGAGIDTLKGGADDDTYRINLALAAGLVVLEDTVTELLNEGKDTLILEGLAALSAKATTWTLWDHVENVDSSQTGATKIYLTGNDLDNTLIGNAAGTIMSGGAGDDILDGGAGNDRLIGGIGADDLTGGTGNDVYELDEFDTVHEVAGEGYDRAEMTATQAGLTFDLATTYAEVERFTLMGAHAGDVNGNDYDNLLTGNVAVNLLTGGKGNDTLDGGAGDDEITGGEGNDILTGGADSDSFVFAAFGDGKDRITDFNKASDKLSFDDVLDVGGDGILDDLRDAIANIDDQGAGKNVVVTFDNGSTLTFDKMGTGAITDIAQLVQDPNTQIVTY